ncbi:hypothetical protein S40285_08070 [Stachybotrys chlorohalonatus IBT 40285]|uniref:Sulfotransferase domain-containing protein n=1 Tax=Stachybotrys chlorohalonatus (strain IBT 40285) TaxID=1283841 RepID=A0A084Q8G8_STAC4|nr:hypothetical protein S40285_08070 [Stachybotrys chlorohalonata IBT 40285]
MASQDSTRVVPLKVIVAGVQRTGTLSMQHALMKLGFYDCYHMVSFAENCSRDAPQWIRAMEAKFEGKGTFDKKDWDKLLGKYQAVCDQPATFFAADLAELYPDAKVIILNRDPEKWYHSVTASIYASLPLYSPFFVIGKLYCLLFDYEARSILKYFQLQARVAQPYNHGKEKEKAISWFKGMYKEFRERIPKERRMEFQMGDGWGPLCEFLGCDIPMEEDASGKLVEAPFPRKNDAQQFHQLTDETWAKSHQRATDTFMGLVGRATMLGALGYGGYVAFNMLQSYL